MRGCFGPRGRGHRRRRAPCRRTPAACSRLPAPGPPCSPGPRRCCHPWSRRCATGRGRHQAGPRRAGCAAGSPPGSTPCPARHPSTSSAPACRPSRPLSDPPLVHLTPSARLRRIITVPIIRPRRHEAPAPNPGGAGVSVIEIRPPEQKVANLMSTYAELPIRRHSQFRSVARHDSRVRRVVSQPVLVIRVELHGVWQAQWAHDLPLDVHQVVGNLLEVVPDAVGAHSEPEAVVEAGVVRGVELAVRKVHQDHGHVVDAAGLGAGGTRGGERGARAEGALRAQQPVVEAWGAPLDGAQEVLEECVGFAAGDDVLQLLEAREDLLPDLGVWGDETPRFHGVWRGGCGVHVLFLQECDRSERVDLLPERDDDMRKAQALARWKE